jgi:hypothetical protein
MKVPTTIFSWVMLRVGGMSLNWLRDYATQCIQQPGETYQVYAERCADALRIHLANENLMHSLLFSSHVFSEEAEKFSCQPLRLGSI